MFDVNSYPKSICDAFCLPLVPPPFPAPTRRSRPGPPGNRTCVYPRRQFCIHYRLLQTRKPKHTASILHKCPKCVHWLQQMYSCHCCCKTHCQKMLQNAYIQQPNAVGSDIEAGFVVVHRAFPATHIRSRPCAGNAQPSPQTY